MEREIGAVAAAMGLRGFRYRRFAPPAFPDTASAPPSPAPATAAPEPAAAPLPIAPPPAMQPPPRPATPPAPAFALLGEVARHRPQARPAAPAPTRTSRRPGAFAALAARQAPPQDS